MQDYLVCIGSSGERLFAFLKQKLGTNEGIHKFKKQAMAEFIEHTRTLPVMEGTIELVTAAKKEGLRLVIAISAARKKPQAHLKWLQLLEYFDASSTAKLSRYIKSAPDIPLKVTELLGCSCTECLAIGDSRNRLVVVDRAGIPCLIVPDRVTESSDFMGCYRKVSPLRELELKELIADLQPPQ